MIFWRMTGLAAASPVNAVLEKENFTLEDLLDEDEIIQECRALNTRLVNYLRQKTQVEQLLHYIVEAPPEDAENKRIFKFPFVACEIFICEVDVILNSLVEDEELMALLFSFLKPDHPHNTLLAGYFSKVVICLMIRKTAVLMNYVQGHKEIFQLLVDLIGVTSIMEVLIRLIGAHENMYPSYVDEMQWLKDIDVLEMIVDKFSSSDSPEVHANVAEVLCAIIRCAPPVLGAKICSSSFMGRLFHHALDSSRPKSVLVHSLSVCISLLDPKRLVTASYSLFRSQLTQGSLVAANPETVDGMLGSLGDLLKLLDVSSAAIFFPTTYGYLKPPFGRHRLKIVEFISVLLTIGSEAAERELVERGAIKHIIEMFFEYPFNNFLHHKVESIIESCLESKSTLLIEHVLQDCDIIKKILGAEKQPLLLADCSKPTTATRGRSPPRIGNFGHMTRIANKLTHLANSNNLIKTHLQENEEWVVWHSSVLVKRNAIENAYRWSCGRPNALRDQGRDGDSEYLDDRDCDVVTLVNNLNQALKNDGIIEELEESDPHSLEQLGLRIPLPDHLADEDHASLEQDDKDACVENKAAQDVSSLCPADNLDGSTSEGDPGDNGHPAHFESLASCSDQSREDQVDRNDNLIDSRISLHVSDSNIDAEEPKSLDLERSPIRESEDAKDSIDLPDPNPIVSSPKRDAKSEEVELTVNAQENAELLAESIKESEDSREHAPVHDKHAEVFFAESIRDSEDSTESNLRSCDVSPEQSEALANESSDANPIDHSQNHDLEADDTELTTNSQVLGLLAESSDMDLVPNLDIENSTTDPSEEFKPVDKDDEIIVEVVAKDTKAEGSVENAS